MAVLAIASVPLAIAGLWAYMSLTARPLFPTPNDVPSLTQPDPPSAGAAEAPQLDARLPDATERARQIARTVLSEQNLPGLSVAVGVGGAIVWAEGFGWADVEDKRQVAPDMSFRIGSASTALTSAAAGLLIEDGRLRLDEPIQTYVPGWPVKQWPVTVRQLMGNVAGVANDGGDESPLFTHRCERPADAVQLLSGYELELLFEPGTRYGYSAYGWILVSAAIEAAAREPFLAFMKEKIFDPLGMRDTRADSLDAPTMNRATPYFPRFAADPRYGLDLMRPLDYSCYSGAGAFLSTPSDLVRFATAIQTGKLLKPATIDLLQTPQRLTSGEVSGSGLGWDVDNVMLGGEPVRSVGRAGDVLGGNASSFLMFPDRGIVVAVISNSSYADTRAIALKVAEAFAGSSGRAPLTP